MVLPTCQTMLMARSTVTQKKALARETNKINGLSDVKKKKKEDQKQKIRKIRRRR